MTDDKSGVLFSEYPSRNNGKSAERLKKSQATSAYGRNPSSLSRLTAWRISRLLRR